MNFFGGYNIYREPDALKWMDWIPTGGRRKIMDSIHVPGVDIMCIFRNDK